ncbi:MAG: transcriptional regulator with XRE-family HTH domain [Cellvibrionaceae bacterium]|jgi:transcriptional regulator with XRE-family HTH domain
MNNVDQIRAKILGVLVRDARIHAGRSIEESSRVLGIPIESFEKIEKGLENPDMPFLEALSLYLNVPFERFWGDQTLGGFPVEDFGELIAKRHETLAAQIKALRESSEKSVVEVAKVAGVGEERLKGMEEGSVPITIFEAEKIANALSLSMRELQDKGSDNPLFKHEEIQKLMKQIYSMPEGMRAFIVQPINQPYVEMAMKLSKMEVNRMRDFAADILEITL